MQAFSETGCILKVLVKRQCFNINVSVDIVMFSSCASVADAVRSCTAWWPTVLDWWEREREAIFLFEPTRYF